MYTTRDAMLMDYAYVGEDQVEGSQLCPSCKGGATGEKSMSVGRTNGLLWWKCHRNSCGFSGGARVGDSAGGGPKRQGMVYVVEPLFDEMVDYLSTKFGIDSYTIQNTWMWTDNYSGRVVMPIFDEHNRRCGDLLRSYYGQEPKALINRLDNYKGGSWYNNTKYPTHIVVVEDQPSALKLSAVPGVNAIALLGTSMSDELSNRIHAAYPGIPVVISLDQDATSTALLTVVNARRFIKNIKMITLNKDIKNMDTKEFDEYRESLTRSCTT